MDACLMSVDAFVSAQLRQPQLAVAVAVTTDTVRAAQQSHGLASSSAVALGRLLTASALTGLMRNTPGNTSLQVVCQGRLANIYAEVNEHGDLRGFIRHVDLDLPQMNAGGPERRRSVALGVGQGVLAGTRQPPQGSFVQSTTDLISGEIDLDVEHFLEASDQVPSLLRCDVLLDDSGQVLKAAGVLLQLLPGGDEALLLNYRTMLDDGLLTQVLGDPLDDATALLHALVPGAEQLEASLPLRWRCRCSYERVVSALQMLDLDELQSMVESGEVAGVRCDFCGASFEVQTPDIRRALEAKRGANHEVQ
ncbi:MAG: Hsp33 family molecular chaperone HslO [Pseudomonadota bacterium]